MDDGRAATAESGVASDRLETQLYKDPMAPAALAAKAGLLGPADTDWRRAGEAPADRVNRDDGVYAVEWQMSLSPSGR